MKKVFAIFMAALVMAGFTGCMESPNINDNPPITIPVAGDIQV